MRTAAPSPPSWPRSLARQAGTLACALALAAPAVAQQGGIEGGAAGGGRSGLGIQIDLGQALRGLGALLGARASEPAPSPSAPSPSTPARSAPAAPTADDADDLPGQIVAAWAVDAPLSAGDLTAAAGAQLVSTDDLPALGLRLAVLAVSPTQVDAALQTLRQRYPEATFDRHARLTPQQGSPPRQYAAALVGAEPPPAPLPQPVRIGVIDGDPAPAAPPLQAAALYRHVFGQAGVGAEHAAAVVCELVCAPSTGFSGLARGAQLWAAPVLRQQDGRVFSDTATVARALDWLSSQRVSLVNLSLGSAPDAVLARVVAAAQRSGVRLVAAAGNAGPNRPLPYPAALPGVIAVAAVDAAAHPYAQGNRGAQVLLAAPGVDLWLPIGGGQYFTGTSFAAPWVTAWMAQRVARGQPANEAALCAAARDLPPPGRDPASGCGLLRWGA